MKLESTKSKHPQLVYEAKLYKILQGAVGIPYIRWYGVETFPQGSYNVLVMDLLGYSLEDLFNRCGRRFSLVRCARRRTHRAHSTPPPRLRRMPPLSWQLRASRPSPFLPPSLPLCALPPVLPPRAPSAPARAPCAAQKTVLMLADQTLLRIEYIHSKSFIHRVRCCRGRRSALPGCRGAPRASPPLLPTLSRLTAPPLAQDIKPDNFLMGTGR